jgi:hypothetical protein
VVSGAAVMNRSVIFLPLGLAPAPACSLSALKLTAFSCFQTLRSDSAPRDKDSEFRNGGKLAIGGNGGA